MALSIKNPRADELATEFARLSGESKAQVLLQALEEKLSQLRKESAKKTLVEEVLEIARQVDELPELDNRMPDEILGYDENGLPA